MSMSDIRNYSPDPASILWQKVEICRGFQYEAIVWMQQETSVDDANEEGEKDNDMEFMYYFYVYFMYRSRGDRRQRQKRLANWNTPSRFKGRSSFGENSTGAPNVPLALAVSVLALELPDNFERSLLAGISHSSKNLTTSTARMNHQISMFLRVRMISLQQEGEDRCDALRRGLLYADHVSGSLQDTFHNESKFPKISQKRLHERSKMMTSGGDCCCICLENLSGFTSQLICSHVYHYHCIFNWLHRSNCCPLCRAPYRRFY